MGAYIIQKSEYEGDAVKDDKSFARTVWETLNRIDVTPKLQQKGNLDYLSWSYAWGALMDFYPESRYKFDLDQPVEEAGYEVTCKLTVVDGDQSLVRTMWLPVMDFKNQPIIKPSVMDINKARMRCLVKAIAMAGLAHYVYTNEDLPMDDGPKKRINKQAMQASVRAILDGLASGDDSMVYEAYEELSRDEQLFVWRNFDTKQRNEIKRVSFEANKKVTE